MSHGVAIIIPAFNAAQTLATTVESVMDQTVPANRVVVVDDGSVDDTAQIAQSYASRDERVSVLRQSNRGLSAARNAGCRSIKNCDSVLFLDADDTLLPNCIETLLDGKRAHPSAIPCAAAEVVNESDERIGYCAPEAPLLGLREMAQLSPVLTHCQLFPTRLMREYQYSESHRLAEDYELYLRLARIGVQWRTVQTRVARYLVRAGSISSGFSEMHHASQQLVESATATADLRGAASLSEEEVGSIRAGITLAYASRIAVADGIEAAMALINSARDDAAVGPLLPRHIQATRLARAGRDAMLFGAGVDPTRYGTIEQAHRQRLRSFWSALAHMTGRPMNVVDEADSGIPIAGRTAIDRANEILDGCAGAATIEVVGYGKNGMTIVSEAIRRGITVFVRDERIDRGVIEIDGGSGCQQKAWDAPFQSGVPIIVSIADDDSLIDSLPSASCLIRWAAPRSGEGWRESGAPEVLHAQYR